MATTVDGVNVLPGDCGCDGNSTSGCNAALTSTGWCDALNNPVEVLWLRDCVTDVVTVEYRDPDTGAIVVPTFPLAGCGGGRDFEQLAICDVNPGTGATIEVYLVRTVETSPGVFTTTFISLATGLPYIPTGVPRFCGDGVRVDSELACLEDTISNAVFPAMIHTQTLGGTIVAKFATTPDGLTLIPGFGVTVVAVACPETVEELVCEDQGITNRTLIRSTWWAITAGVPAVTTRYFDPDTRVEVLGVIPANVRLGVCSGACATPASNDGIPGLRSLVVRPGLVRPWNLIVPPNPLGGVSSLDFDSGFANISSAGGGF